MELQAAHPNMTQLWYANNAGVRGSLLHINLHLEDFMVRGLACRQFLDSSKIILVVSEGNVPWVQTLFIGMRLWVVMGS